MSDPIAKLLADALRDAPALEASDEEVIRDWIACFDTLRAHLERSGIALDDAVNVAAGPCTVSFNLHSMLRLHTALKNVVPLG